MSRRSMQHILFYALLAVAAYVLYMIGLAIYSWQRPELGPVGGSLRPCAASPNCVCSQASPAERTVAALSIGSESPPAAFDRARQAVEALPRVVLVEASAGYAHYECSTRLFRFADDVELLLDEPAGVIHIRSSSRVGYSDLGANRKRVEEIHRQYSENR